MLNSLFSSRICMTYLQLDVEQQSFYKSWVFDNYVIIYPVSNYIPWISCVIWHMSVCYEHERKSVRNLNKIKFLQCRMTLYYNLLSFCQWFIIKMSILLSFSHLVSMLLTLYQNILGRISYTTLFKIIGTKYHFKWVNVLGTVPYWKACS